MTHREQINHDRYALVCAWRAFLRTRPDDDIRAPMWFYPPTARGPLISERRRRFMFDGNDPEEIL